MELVPLRLSYFCLCFFPSGNRVTHFFKSLGKKKFSQRSLALSEQTISVSENGATDHTDESLEGNTQGVYYVEAILI